ncbi:MAG: hypothetical protein ACRDA5_07010, partial [Clostridium sp.]
MFKYFLFCDDDNSGFNFIGGLVVFIFSLAAIESMWSSFIGKRIVITLGLCITRLYKPDFSIIKNLFLKKLRDYEAILMCIIIEFAHIKIP